ncbi:hypothetical protein FB639_003383 [Coemansia asiatica]|nr:hypothetical protein FB639_003383 [Coemansia asiatica]
MSRPTRRHARKASATTAEEILLPAELMAGLTSTLSPATPPFAHMQLQTPKTAPASTVPTAIAASAPPLDKLQPMPDISALDLAPLFPAAAGSSPPNTPPPAAAAAAAAVAHDSQQDSASSPQTTAAPELAPVLEIPHAQPDKGILKAPKDDDANGSSKWSIWPGAKKWFSEAILPGARYDIPQHPTFAHGAGIPAASRSPTDDANETAALTRTAPSLDFERTTSFVPPLSQERIKSTEFWTNFALELDPSKLKRIRFSMPIIVTEFGSDSSSQYTTTDSDSGSESESDSSSSSSSSSSDPANRAAKEQKSNDNDMDDDGDQNSDDIPASSKIMAAAAQEPTDHLCRQKHASLRKHSRKPSCSNAVGTSYPEHPANTQSANTQSASSRTSLQWDVNALSQRQYRVQEVWELYERNCRSLDTEPVPSIEKTLLGHVRKGLPLGTLDLTSSQLNGAHMKCFADMLDLNFGLSKLELSHCGIDDDAVRLLAYSLLCNDSVRYLSLANNPRLRSDGVRYISILVRHSKQLHLLDISGVNIRKKSAGYLAAALAGLGANWSLGRGSMHRKPTACEQISLQALRMNSCGIKPAALSILASGIRLSPLQHLSLRLNSLNGSAGPILREMLYGDPPQLSLDKPSLPARRPVSVSLHALSDAQNYANDPASASPMPGGYPTDSPRVSRLRSLDLSQNDLGRAVMDLAEGLLWNTNLRSLILRQNKLQPATLAPFIECLGINRGLVYLDISRNPVCGPSPTVLEVLSQVVTQNHALKGLFMSNTGMTSEGAILLAECLPELQRLERLDVSENPAIDVAGLMALSASIKLNKSLICVEITVNTGDDVCSALEQGIAQTCIANMQRLDPSTSQSSSSLFGFELASPKQPWPLAELGPESEFPGVLETKVSGENDRYECTSLVTDVAAVKRFYHDPDPLSSHAEDDFSSLQAHCDDDDDNNKNNITNNNCNVAFKPIQSAKDPEQDINENT